MGLKVGDLFAALHLDTSKFSEGLDASEKHAKGWGSRIGSAISTGAKVATAAIAGIGLALVGIGVASLGNAKDVQETNRIVTAAFGKAGKAVNDWAGANAMALGVEDDALARSVASYGRWAQNIGISSGEAQKQGEALAKRAAQISATTGADYETVFEGLQKGMQGSARGLKAYGIQIDTATLKQQAMKMGLYSGKGQLDANAAAQARYALILEQSTKFVGTAAEATKQQAFQEKQLGVVLDQTMDTIGMAVQPVISIILTSLMPVLQGFGQWVSDNAGNIQATLQGVFQAIGTAISFFTTNILPVLVSMFGTFVNDILPTVVTALSGIASTVFPIFSKAFSVFTTDVLPVLQAAFNTFVTVILPALGKAFNDIATAVIPIFNDAFSFITTTVFPAIQAAIGFVANEVLPRLGSAFNWITKEVLPPVMGVLRDLANAVLPVVRDALKFVAETVLPAVWAAFRTLEKDVLPPIASAIDNVAKVVIPPLRTALEFIGNTVLPALGTAFGVIVNDVLPPIVTAIGTVVNTVLPPLRSALEFLTNTVLPALGGAFATIQTTVTNVWNGLVGVIKGAINTVIGVINGFIDALNSIQIHIPGFDTPLGKVGQFDWGGLNLGHIPYLAKGARNFIGGLAVVGERGPEVVSLPRGSNVYPHGVNVPGSVTLYATFNVTKDQTPEQFARESMQALKREVDRQGISLVAGA